MIRYCVFLLLYSLVVSCGFAQPLVKKILDHTVYDSWKKITGESVSADGRIIIYSVEPQEGDAKLIIHSIEKNSFDTLVRGVNAKIDRKSAAVIYSIKPFFAQVKKAKIAKKKADDMPKDSLGIYYLAGDSLVKIPRVKSFKLPEKGSGWIAYQLEKDPADTSKQKKNSEAKKDHDAPDDKSDAKDEKGTTVVVRQLSSGQEFKFLFANEYLFSKDGSRLMITSTGNDSTVKPAAIVFSTVTEKIDTLMTGKGKILQPSLAESGNQGAFLADRDTSKAKQRYFKLYYWKSGENPVMLADTATPGMTKEWLVSENGKITFSKDGGKLFFGTAPLPVPEDTTMNDEETAKLDVWNWQDDNLQPMQLKDLDKEKKRSFAAVVHLKKRKLVQLAGFEIPSVVFGNEGIADVALAVTDVPYRRQQSWGEGGNDAYIVDLLTGEKKKIVACIDGTPALSPNAMYVSWYSGADSNWFVYSLKTGKTVNLTKGMPFPFYDELNDVPDYPGSYGLLGWSENDDNIFIYDKYDIWKFDPDGKEAPVNFTAGAGRSSGISFRYVKLDPDEKFIKPDQTLLLKTFRFSDKSAGFSVMKNSGAAAPVKRIMEQFTFSTPQKAESGKTVIVSRSNFRNYPDLYITDEKFSSFEKISDVNPQQGDYLWGTVELVSWFAADGKPLDGLLYKPDNFDPAKKYPMVVYFYERNSDLLYRYFSPAPSASTVNIPLYVSRGYIVFVPDIRYRVGYPGKSALDCIVPGVLKMIASGFVDSSNIGIQGQSWGGYQVAYLVTHSTMFKCGMAGAPVSNMTSAYGGIRWESGMSRMWQYEKEQSRIGGSLWDKPLHFIENSPLFRACDVTAPLLIMHNDNDGAVPWYQGIELFTALRRLNKPSWMLTYNGEAHNLEQRKNRKDLSIRMLQFFDHYLKGEAAPVWMTKGLPALEKGKKLRYEK